MTGTVSVVAGRGREAAAAIEASLDAGSGPQGRLTVVREAQEQLSELLDVVTTLELDAGGWLVPPLANARRMLTIGLADARSDLERSLRLAHALEGFLEGPRRYLVLGGNNAEMRAVGIPTTSGVATIADGAIDMGEFSAANDQIELPEPGVPVPLEYEALYGWLNGDRGYRTTLASANWPVVAEIAGDITAANQYGPVDGIIYVDTVTLAVLLHVIGPIEVDGVEYNGTNVIPALLHEQYLAFRTLEDNPERRSVQSAVARTIFDELDQREFSVLELAGNLATLAHGRHILAWAEDPDENALWESFGADGRLRSDGLLVVSQDLGASKLDYYVQQAVAVDVEDADDGAQRVTVAVTLTNPEHPTTSPYVDGGGRYAEAGEYGSWLLAYLPEAAFDIRVDTGFTHHGPDGPMYVVGTILRVPEGESRTIEFTFSLPDAMDILTVLPSARLWGTTWTWGDEEQVDAEPFELDLRDA